MEYTFRAQEIGMASLNNHGVRLGDKLVIRPFQGKKKQISLNREKLLFSSSCAGQINLNPCSGAISLPSVGEKDWGFQLHLVAVGRKNEIDQNGRYILKSNHGVPFKINGMLAFESFIERGDVVELEYNQLSFLSCSESRKSKDSNGSGFSQKITNSEISILYVGETGTGKTYLAHQVHLESGRAGNFVHLNLSSFSPSLIESELFGHIKGAFTGAIREKQGAILEASQGTLFLDEIDSLPFELQTKLLLFLDSKMVRAVGGFQSKKSDARLIFASGQNLEKLVNQKEMRKDFYYRISSGMVKQLEPLRENKRRIANFCEAYCLDKKVYLSPQLEKFILEFSWPGNLRQLIGHLDKKYVLSKGPRLEFCSEDSVLINESLSLPEYEEEEILTISELKKRHALKTYYQTGRNIKASAKVLGITANTMRTLMRKTKDGGATEDFEFKLEKSS
ncbi:MAG: sigma 54-interacting transcriptional regulator [Halobacteriovoraceae bacterium]|jgi:hypothetical protein|nr:sigma 54-interacting transcriptional regulator [Halobacteriovoraceae bacterium]